MDYSPQFARIDGKRTSVVWMRRGCEVDCLYLGSRLPANEDLGALAIAKTHSRHENEPDIKPTGGLMPDPATGWRGPTLFELRGRDGPFEPSWDACTLSVSQNRLVSTWKEAKAGLKVSVAWELRAGDIIAAKTSIAVSDTTRVTMLRLSALLLTLPRGLAHVTHFAGRWADDMRSERLPITRAGLSWSSRAGKSAFAGGDWLIFDDERSGQRLGFHASWSGDHVTRIERNEDGVITLCSEEPADDPPRAFEPKEAVSPEALFAWAPDAVTLTRAFHSYARVKAAKFSGHANPVRTRKVHFNTWEACAFDFDETRLFSLAHDAAALGAERFVLDDGWFKGRSSDQAGLGDWTPDPVRLPNGLHPLIDHVKSLEMDFGLWVEPEMVSPDSDLYRAHPDWCIHPQSDRRPTERSQLVLDLSHGDAFDYVFDRVDSLLREHDIAYLKWDHNRRLFPQTAQFSREQAQRFVILLGRLREAHPAVMIESCSSGGGRIDMHIAGLCERFWPSDNNDPVERVRIMREWSRFLPLELLGNHVGPSPNPITGRHSAMDFRAKIALFGHMGVEADPATMSAEEREILKAHIAIYKRWRSVLHSGDFVPLDHPDPAIFSQAVVTPQCALVMAAQTAFSPDFDAAPVRLKGLASDAFYRVTLPQPWPARAAHYLMDKRAWRDGFTLSGRALMDQGLALPLTHPETAWLIALEKVDA